MYTVPEAAAILGLSENGVRLLDDKLLPRRLANNSRRYTRSSVENLAAQRRARKAPATQRRDRILARVDHRGGRK